METGRCYKATASRSVVLIKICHCSRTAIVLTQDSSTNNADIHTYTGETCVGGGKGANAPPLFFYLRIFLTTLLKRGKWKVCLYIKNWSKPALSIVLDRHLRKLNFLVPMVDLTPPTGTVLLDKLRLYIHPHRERIWTRDPVCKLSNTRPWPQVITLNRQRYFKNLDKGQ
jgi:hypothetical protein